MNLPSHTQPLDYATMTETVYGRLRFWIVSGELAPGARISIRSLAGLLGTSATPVREALKRLQADGLIVATTRRELTVTQLDAQEVHDVFEIRLRLEALANEWAIDNVDEETVRRLEELADAMEDPAVDPDQWREHNREFHRVLYALSESKYLLELIETAWDKTEPYLAIYVRSVSAFTEANHQHRALLGHIRNRDLHALQEELSAHVQYTWRTVTQAIASGGDKPPVRDRPNSKLTLI